MARSHYLRIWIGSALTLTALVFASLNVIASHAAPLGITLPHTVVAAISSAQQTGDMPAQTKMSVTFALRSRDQAGLQNFARDVSTPRTAVYHHHLTSAQFALTFGPDPATLNRLEAFVQNAGLHVDRSWSGGMYVQVSGTTQAIENALHTHIGMFRSAQGQAFFANTGAITLPQVIAPAVAGVTGLDNVAKQHKHTTPPRPVPHTPQNGPKTTSCPPTTGTSALTPIQLATAYNFPTNLPNPNGTGERIAMVEFDGYSKADVAVYTNCYVPAVNVASVVSDRLVDLPAPLVPADGAIEDELDIEVALGMAPGLSKVDVYQAPNSNQGAIDMLASIASDDVDGTISDSWGQCETDAGTNLAASEEGAFLQMAAQGQGVYVASGDNGAYDCSADGSPQPNYALAIDDPSSNPYVTAVGGTNLTQLAQGASYISETVWNASANGGGGGISQIWSAPTWQITAHATQTSGGVTDPNHMRVSPDVSANADPNTGYAVYCTVGASCTSIGNSWLDVGGTSASTPLWAALAAIANQVAGTRVGLITPALYSLYSADVTNNSASGITSNGTTYYDYAAQVNGATAPNAGAIVLNDITVGNNTFSGQATGFSAQKGYDAGSGLGSMNGKNVVAYLVNALRFTAPRFYMVAQGTNNGYWLSSYLMNTGDGNLVLNAPQASNWLSLGSQPFQGMPAVANNGVATTSLTGVTGLEWVTGVRADGVVLYGAYNPATTTFGGWTPVPAMSGATLCVNSTAMTLVQQSLFVTCKTPSGAIILDTFNATTLVWTGWQTIGGGLTAPPTMATDGSRLLLFAQTANPNLKGGSIDWYTFYDISAHTMTPWHPFYTTCVQAPSLTHTTANDYAISCIASDTSTMWTNGFTAVSELSSSLSGWSNLGSPSGVGFVNATAVTIDMQDSPSVLMYVGQGANNAAYTLLSTTNANFAAVRNIWHIASLPGIFKSNAATDYFTQ